MLQHSWLNCYYTIAVIKLTKATSQLRTGNTASWHGSLLALPLSPKSRYHPADQTAVTPIVKLCGSIKINLVNEVLPPIGFA